MKGHDRFYDSVEEAKKALGEDADTISLAYRTEEERRALELAFAHGNRYERRHRKFGRKEARKAESKPSKANKRAAKRRTAKASRRKNRG